MVERVFSFVYRHFYKIVVINTVIYGVVMSFVWFGG